MPVLQFKGKTAIECYHHIIPHHTLEFDSKLSISAKGEKAGLDGNLIIEGDNLIALKALDNTEKNRNVVIYCEKKWVHPDDLAKYELDTKRTVRAMIVPFNLK